MLNGLCSLLSQEQPCRPRYALLIAATMLPHHRYDRYAHLAMAAAKTAMADGGLDKGDVDSKRFGVLIGSGVGGLEAVETSCRCVKLCHEPPSTCCTCHVLGP